jgi:hypothetical protein
MLADTPQRKGRAGEAIDRIRRAQTRTQPPGPIGGGRDFLGTCDLFPDAPLLFERGGDDRWSRPCVAATSTTRNSRDCCRKQRSPNCARRSRSVRTGLFPGPPAQPRRGSLARRHRRHPSHGSLQIGDTLTGSEAIPSLRRRTGATRLTGPAAARTVKRGPLRDRPISTLIHPVLGSVQSGSMRSRQGALILGGALRPHRNLRIIT